jgi:hypothetical protein
MKSNWASGLANWAASTANLVSNKRWSWSSMASSSWPSCSWAASLAHDQSWCRLTFPISVLNPTWPTTTSLWPIWLRFLHTSLLEPLLILNLQLIWQTLICSIAHLSLLLKLQLKYFSKYSLGEQRYGLTCWWNS